MVPSGFDKFRPCAYKWVTGVTAILSIPNTPGHDMVLLSYDKPDHSSMQTKSYQSPFHIIDTCVRRSVFERKVCNVFVIDT